MAVLETQRTILRPFEETDAADLYAYAKDPRVGPVAGWKPHGSVEESLEIIRSVFAAPHTFAVVDKASGAVVGSAGFVTPHKPGDAAHQGRSMELGYALSPAYWGRGVMPEVVWALLRYGFETVGLDEIWCTHYQENHRSRRVIEKSGFFYAFTDRLSDEFHQDRPTCFYFMTRDMWEKRGG